MVGAIACPAYVVETPKMCARMVCSGERLTQCAFLGRLGGLRVRGWSRWKRTEEEKVMVGRGMQKKICLLHE